MGDKLTRRTLDAWIKSGDNEARGFGVGSNEGSAPIGGATERLPSWSNSEWEKDQAGGTSPPTSDHP
jgi:hypothetical protein